MPRTTPESVQSFQQRAADLFAGLAAGRAVSDAGLSTSLSGARIDGTVSTPAGAPVTVTVKVDDNHGLPAGYQRSDFTAEKLAEMDAEALRKAKDRVWNQIRSMADRAISGDQAVEMLTALGYGDASKPTGVTTCTVHIPAKRKDGSDERSITLNGLVSKEDIVTAVTNALPADPELHADRVIAAAFGEKLSSGTRDLVTVTNYSSKTVWPEKSEFAAK